MRLLNTVYVNEHGARIGYRRGSVTIASPDGSRRRVPINAIDGIVLTARAQPSAELLSECARRRIRLGALTRNGRLRFAVAPPTSGNVHLRVSQCRLADQDEAVSALARTFVAGKLQNCRRMLQRWSRDAQRNTQLIERQQGVIEERLRGLASASDGDRIRGIEGDATRRYFRGMALRLGETASQFAFVGRSRRPPRDPLNAALSYTYGLVLAEVVGALDAVGLDPQVGFLHGIRSGRPSLALDLLEELRPSQADRFVMRCIGRQQLSIEGFTMAAGGSCYLTDEGRTALLEHYETYKSEEITHPLLQQQVSRSQVPQIQATLLARRIRGDLPAYPPYVVEA